MKKLIALALALMTMGTMQAQDVVSLPQPEVNKLSMPLGDVLQKRRSERKYSSQEISLQTLSTILWAACGVNDPKTGKITAPSAVNMQDIKIYVCSKDGACLYNAKANTLTKVYDKDLREVLAGRQAFAKSAPITLLLVSTKATDRSPNERYGAVDAGYVSQNIYLACTALGMKTVARAQMDADALRQALNLPATTFLELNHPIGY
jgi:SagB-type dehydrogenase family enzyme